MEAFRLGAIPWRVTSPSIAAAGEVLRWALPARREKSALVTRRAEKSSDEMENDATSSRHFFAPRGA